MRGIGWVALHFALRGSGQVCAGRDNTAAARAAEGEKDNAGVVTFHRLDDTTTRVMLQVEYATSDFIEKAGSAVGVVDRRVKGDLERFKEFIKERGSETGAWRGRVEQRKVG
jgi:uncharacterized membrane protein